MNNAFSNKFIADEKNLALLHETMCSGDRMEYGKPKNWHRISQSLRI